MTNPEDLTPKRPAKRILAKALVTVVSAKCTRRTAGELPYDPNAVHENVKLALSKKRRTLAFNIGELDE